MSVRLVVLALPALALLALAACGNPCQDLCQTMADYAVDQCGLPVSDAEIDACRADQRKASSDDKAVCRDAGDSDQIAAEWGCDELQDYWASTGGADDTDGG